MKTVLLLEDDPDRIAAFEQAVRALGTDWRLRLWKDAPAMLAECEACFDDTHLISLDHDLNPHPGCAGDPGCGLDIAKLLASHLPFCPVIIHSSNSEKAWSMHDELRFAGWRVERVGPIGEDWIPKLWLPLARELVSTFSRQHTFSRPPDHRQRLDRAFTSLEGLAIGDALGEMLAYRHFDAPAIIARELPAGPWFHTDDTEMAISIVEVLKIFGYIEPDALARRFAWRFEREPDRGYGSMTRTQLNQILRGAKWRYTAAAAFGGQGSMGNGGAMRVAPLGAYFADDFARAAEQASISAAVTHTHPEGIAGAIAVAVAAAAATRGSALSTADFFDAVLRFTPDSEVRRKLVIAAQTPDSVPVHDVAEALGNGSLVTAPDTVPFAVWCAAHFRSDLVRALGTTISAGGDCDTNAAIVGGVVALSAGRATIPPDWKASYEPLPFPELRGRG